MQERSGSLIEWLVPLGFIFCSGWVIWHMPAFTLDFAPPDDPSQFDKLSALFQRNDVTPGLGGLFGGFADAVDWLAMLGLPLFAILGVITVRRAPMEFESWRPADRLAVFIGRITMMLVVVLCCVMLYEVFVRYVLNAATLWANELSLWLAGFIFLCAGLYAMQQRSHIRIFLLYDYCPRSVQRLFDCISTFLIVVFAFFLVFGGYGEAFDKFYRWETFGTAFDPPIPATIKPAVLIVISLVALQAVVNLISDWNAEPVIHTAADDIDEDELRRMREAVGDSGVGDKDVTRSAVQHGAGGKD
ncbi:TRAP transporter small permease subunit [Thalassococcus sp. S3]|uniref:TRAP transporter small permease subunit n=1 Tax=Thalassococcus sp. S3 TaxID=2017482 RepID=UPI0010242860|nr:TRAP transporter small permease [Thalassococcus sp. S3]QBF34312.1 C4-dicarboxylate ABC transporter substrate-binding protein [Thalassococcus sp. S3]